MSVARWILLGVVLCSLGAVTTDTAQLTVAAPVASNWPTSELACDNLGAACVYSDTLDRGPGLVSNNDPSNTLDCDHPGGIFAAVPEPIGSIAVNALHFDQAQPSSASSCDRSFSTPLVFTEQTFAMRTYEWVDPTHQIPDNTIDQRFKLFRAHSPNSGPHPGFETSSTFGCDGVDANSCPIAFDFVSFGNSTFRGATDIAATWIAPNGQPTLGDFLGEWMRIEVAFTHYPISHPTTPNQLAMRGRVTRLSDSMVWETDLMVAPTSQTTAEIVTDPMGGNANKAMLLDTPQMTADRWASALMGAVVAPDDTFFIGPACEIEGCP